MAGVVGRGPEELRATTLGRGSREDRVQLPSVGDPATTLGRGSRGLQLPSVGDPRGSRRIDEGVVGVVIRSQEEAPLGTTAGDHVVGPREELAWKAHGGSCRTGSGRVACNYPRSGIPAVGDPSCNYPRSGIPGNPARQLPSVGDPRTCRTGSGRVACNYPRSGIRGGSLLQLPSVGDPGNYPRSGIPELSDGVRKSCVQLPSVGDPGSAGDPSVQLPSVGDRPGGIPPATTLGRGSLRGILLQVPSVGDPSATTLGRGSLGGIPPATTLGRGSAGPSVGDPPGSPPTRTPACAPAHAPRLAFVPGARRPGSVVRSVTGHDLCMVPILGVCCTR